MEVTVKVPVEEVCAVLARYIADREGWEKSATKVVICYENVDDRDKVTSFEVSNESNI